MTQRHISEKTDKRIQNTRNSLKKAFLRLLSEKPLSDISVRELCRVANITSITFYKHFSDKYDLAIATFQEWSMESRKEFHALQAENNPDNEPLLSYYNLLDCILNIQKREREEISFPENQADPYLFFSLSQNIAREIGGVFQAEQPAAEFSVPLISNFFCYGIWGFIAAGEKDALSAEEIREKARALIRDIVEANIFHIPSRKKTNTAS